MNGYHIFFFLVFVIIMYITVRIIRCRLVRANLRILFLKTLDILNRNRINYWVDGGTLIGIHREKDIIIGDTDCDVCIWEKDAHKIKPLLETHNDSELVFKDMGWGFRLYYKRIYYTDIYKANLNLKTNMVEITDCRDTPKHLLEEIETVNVPFYDREIQIRQPVKWEELLEFRYTKDWKVQLHKWWLGYHAIKNVKLA